MNISSAPGRMFLRQGEGWDQDGSRLRGGRGRVPRHRRQDRRARHKGDQTIFHFISYVQCTYIGNRYTYTYVG